MIVMYHDDISGRECRNFVRNRGFLMYSVLLVDDEVLIREAISRNVKWGELGFALAGTCRNGREAIGFLKQERVDLVLTDIYMPYVDGIELAKYIYENCSDTRVVIISGYDEFEYAKQALKYKVVEYILKPVTAMELSELLTRIREQLDEACRKNSGMKRIRGEYMSNFPVLRGRFLHQLLQGDLVLPEQEVRQKMEDYGISFSGNYFIAAAVQVDDVSDFYEKDEQKKDDLALFAVYNIADEMIRETELGVAFQNVENQTELIFSGGTDLEQRASALCERIRSLVQAFLNIGITVGVGLPASSLYQLPKSFQAAREALEYRFQLGNSRVICARQIPRDGDSGHVDIALWTDRIVTAIRGNSGQDIREAVMGFAQAIRESCVSRNRSIFYVQNAIISIANEMESSGVSDEAVMREERELLNSIYEKQHLSEIAQDLLHFCIRVSDLMFDQKDVKGSRQAMLALDYIEKNYANPELSLNSVCSYLAMSTSYFSSVFKNCTGETFIEALTKKRIEKAKTLLANTTKRTYEVAQEVGYADPHYFSSAFKKVTGCTPKEYARKHRE